MVFKFLFPFRQLNLLFLSKEKESGILKKLRLNIMEAIKIFEYKKLNDGYWDKPKPYHQVVTKVILITETFYLRYLSLFLFDNITNFSVYLQNALQIININKKVRNKQFILFNR